MPPPSRLPLVASAMPTKLRSSSHRFAARSVRRAPLVAVAPAVLVLLAAMLFVLPTGAAGTQVGEPVPELKAAIDDRAYPDWCDDENDDPADDCPAEGEAGPTPPTGEAGPTGPTDSDGDGYPDTPGEPQQPQWPPTPVGAVARLAQDGRRAIAPVRAPRKVKDMIHAANRLTRKPYKWGGGHARLIDSGYDCSGATSYVLRAVGLMRGSMVSGGFKRWGIKGAGRWVNVYANNGHVFIVIAGLRFDTSGAGEHGPRWRTEPRWIEGFRLRHPAGY